MEIVIVLMVLGGGLVFAIHQAYLWSERETHRARFESVAVARREEIQGRSEIRAVELMIEFPTLSDDEIATLMRDELINRRSREPRYFEWATTETVARMRRTIIVEHVRNRSTLEG